MSKSQEQEQCIKKLKIRCPYCDNVLFTGNFIGSLQMYCVNKKNPKCKRLLEITVTATSVKVEEVKNVK